MVAGSKFFSVKTEGPLIRWVVSVGLCLHPSGPLVLQMLLSYFIDNPLTREPFSLLLNIHFFLRTKYLKIISSTYIKSSNIKYEMVIYYLELSR